MIQLKTVLVATDFGKTSDAAVDYAREMARTFGAQLHVLHVADNMLTRYALDEAPVSIEMQREYEAALAKQLRAIVREDDRRELGAVAAIRTSNTPADAIVEDAEEIGADVIVVGTHGRKAVAHFFLGSVAERVVRLAPCPVLTVRNPEHEFIAPDALVAGSRL